MVDSTVSSGFAVPEANREICLGAQGREAARAWRDTLSQRVPIAAQCPKAKKKEPPRQAPQEASQLMHPNVRRDRGGASPEGLVAGAGLPALRGRSLARRLPSERERPLLRAPSVPAERPSSTPWQTAPEADGAAVREADPGLGTPAARRHSLSCQAASAAHNLGSSGQRHAVPSCPALIAGFSSSARSLVTAPPQADPVSAGAPTLKAPRAEAASAASFTGVEVAVPGADRRSASTHRAHAAHGSALDVPERSLFLTLRGAQARAATASRSLSSGRASDRAECSRRPLSRLVTGRA
jgi:hypothetical protein